MQSKKQNITTSGATAVAVLLESDKAEPTKRTLHVGNVGDSRAVLVSTMYPTQGETQDPTGEVPSHGFMATRLTFDHRAEDPAEQERIKTAGGFVTRNRVLGILAVSRSFGDHGMKDFVIGKHIYLF
jgi:serine/threonine protein phosphatase PrpC